MTTHPETDMPQNNPEMNRGKSLVGEDLDRWNAKIEGFPIALQQEFRDERPDPTNKDWEAYGNLQLTGQNPVEIPLKKIIEQNRDSILMCPNDVFEEITQKYGLNFTQEELEERRIYDLRPGRYREYATLPAETANPSVMINGNIHWGRGRFIAALLRGDEKLKVWELTKKENGNK